VLVALAAGLLLPIASVALAALAVLVVLAE
jgi:hypothetical protein